MSAGVQLSSAALGAARHLPSYPGTGFFLPRMSVNGWEIHLTMLEVLEARRGKVG